MSLTFIDGDRLPEVVATTTLRSSQVIQPFFSQKTGIWKLGTGWICEFIIH
jgi:hypothetical protein